MQIIEVLVSSAGTPWHIFIEFRGGGTHLTHIKTLDSTPFVCFGFRRRILVFGHMYITSNNLINISEKK